MVNGSMVHRYKLTCTCGMIVANLRLWISTMWLQDLAALVHIAREGNDRGDGLLGEGMKGRWIRIWRW